MANLAYPQPMNPNHGFVNSNAMTNLGPQMSHMFPPFFLPQSPPPQANLYNQTPAVMSPQGTHIAYVPVLIDAQGRPLQNMQTLMTQSFLPTVGLNQAMQAPWFRSVQNPTNNPGVQKMQTEQLTSGTPSATSSDSGSTAGSVSPELAPIARKLPPGFSLDGDESWFKVNEGLLNLENKEQPKPKMKAQPPQPLANKTHKKKKFGYRSKQNKIDTVYASLVGKYTALDTLVDQNEVLRGPDVIRLHVKKFDALCTIEEALEAVEWYIKIVGVSIPLSMKNTFQKKGFLVYIKLEKVEDVERARSILQTFPEFKKCGVAHVAPSPPTSPSV